MDLDYSALEVLENLDRAESRDRLAHLRPYISAIERHLELRGKKLHYGKVLALAKYFYEKNVDSETVGEILDNVDFDNEDALAKVEQFLGGKTTNVTKKEQYLRMLSDYNNMLVEAEYGKYTKEELQEYYRELQKLYREVRRYAKDVPQPRPPTETTLAIAETTTPTTETTPEVKPPEVKPPTETTTPREVDWTEVFAQQMPKRSIPSSRKLRTEETVEYTIGYVQDGDKVVEIKAVDEPTGKTVKPLTPEETVEIMRTAVKATRCGIVLDREYWTDDGRLAIDITDDCRIVPRRRGDIESYANANGNSTDTEGSVEWTDIFKPRRYNSRAIAEALERKKRKALAKARREDGARRIASGLAGIIVRIATLQN